MVAYLAVCARAARTRARIHAVAVAAGHVTATIGMVQTLGAPALTDRIAAVAGRARADRSATDRLLAQSVQAARIVRAALGWAVCGW